MFITIHEDVFFTHFTPHRDKMAVLGSLEYEEFRYNTFIFVCVCVCVFIMNSLLMYVIRILLNSSRVKKDSLEAPVYMATKD